MPLDLIWSATHICGPLIDREAKELNRVLEIATVNCKPGQGAEFERAIPNALAVIAEDKQCLSANAKRCVERPEEFVLLIEWTSIESHTAFRQGPQFAMYRDHIAHLVTEPTTFAHYIPVGE